MFPKIGLSLKSHRGAGGLGAWGRQREAGGRVERRGETGRVYTQAYRRAREWNTQRLSRKSAVVLQQKRQRGHVEPQLVTHQSCKIPKVRSPGCSVTKARGIKNKRRGRRRGPTSRRCTGGQGSVPRQPLPSGATGQAAQRNETRDVASEHRHGDIIKLQYILLLNRIGAEGGAGVCTRPLLKCSLPSTLRALASSGLSWSLLPAAEELRDTAVRPPHSGCASTAKAPPPACPATWPLGPGASFLTSALVRA